MNPGQSDSIAHKLNLKAVVNRRTQPLVCWLPVGLQGEGVRRLEEETLIEAGD